MKLPLILVSILTLTFAATAQAQLSWVGGVAAGSNGYSLFNQSNWIGTGTIGGGTTNVSLTIGYPGTTVGGTTISNYNPGGSGASSSLNTQGHDVTITGNRLVFAANFGVQSSSSATINLQDYNDGGTFVGAKLNTKFIVGFTVNVDPFSSLSIFGNVTPINQSVLNLNYTAGQGSSIIFTNGLPSQFGTDWTSANYGSVITVNGQSALLGSNLIVTPGTGSSLILTAVPEPRLASLVGIFAMASAILFRRSRRRLSATR